MFYPPSFNILRTESIHISFGLTKKGQKNLLAIQHFLNHQLYAIWGVQLARYRKVPPKPVRFMSL